MQKSPIFYNNDELSNWMIEQKFWTNSKFKGYGYSSSDFPMIIYTDYSMDYDNRYRVHIYIKLV